MQRNKTKRRTHIMICVRIYTLISHHPVAIINQSYHWIMFLSTDNFMKRTLDREKVKCHRQLTMLTLKMYHSKMATEGRAWEEGLGSALPMTYPGFWRVTQFRGEGWNTKSSRRVRFDACGRIYIFWCVHCFFCVCIRNALFLEDVLVNCQDVLCVIPPPSTFQYLP